MLSVFLRIQEPIKYKKKSSDRPGGPESKIVLRMEHFDPGVISLQLHVFFHKIVPIALTAFAGAGCYCGAA